MALRKVHAITRIGELTIDEFNRRCCWIARQMAEGIRVDLGSGTVRAHTKTSYSGVENDDVVTDADTNAQGRFVQMADRYLPRQIGYICEEKGVRRPSTFRRHTIVVTVDPADGTRAMILALQAGRLPWPGEVSVMLGLQIDGIPVASYICDVGSMIVYTRSPYGSKVLAIRSDDVVFDTARASHQPTLKSGTLLQHSSRPLRSELGQRLAAMAFGRVESRTCSIGLSVTRIFTGKLVATLRSGGTYFTPWDDTPVQALCGQGGVTMFRVREDRLQEMHIGRINDPTKFDDDVLYVATCYIPELRRYAPVHMLS